MLTVENLSVRYGKRNVLQGLSFTLGEGEWLMLTGPNGAGKSTLIAAVCQGVPYEGEILFDGRSLREERPARRARWIGVLSQQHAQNYAFTVEEIVRLGRYAYQKSWFSRRGDPEGEKAIDEALRLTGMTALRGRSLTTLSGGELQRAFLAQVFAQEPRLLILDEPANHLDPFYQRQIFSLIGDWLHARPDRAALSVVHDLSLARRYGTRAVLLHEGVCAAQGPIGETFEPETLQRVYGLDVYAWMQELLEPWNRADG